MTGIERQALAGVPEAVVEARRIRDLTEGGILRNIWYLALPMMASGLLQDLFNVVDMIFVGRLGKEAVAALAMCAALQGILIILAQGVSSGTIALVARRVGEKNFREAGVLTGQSILLSVAMSVLVAVVGQLFPAEMLRLLGAEEEVVRLGVPYMATIFTWSVTIFLFFSIAASLRAAGDAVSPLWALGVATFINIALDPPLIYGWWIFPRLEVGGSAVATVIARGVAVLILLRIVFKGKQLIRLGVGDVKPDFGRMWQILRIGLFGSLEILTRQVSAMVMMRMVALFGTAAVAAYGIGMRLQMTVLFPGFGLSLASATLVGQNLGARKPARAERTAWVTALAYVIFMGIVGCFFALFPRGVVGIFNDDGLVVSLGTQFLLFGVMGFPFLGISMVLARSLAGAGDTLSPMVVALVSLIGFRVLAGYFLCQGPIGITGIWVGIVLSDIVQALLLCAWFGRGRWKSKII